MAGPSKSAGQSLVVIQQIASNGQLPSSAIDVSGKMSMTLWAWLGRDDTGGALTNPVIVRVQATPEAAGDRYWQDVRTVTSFVTTPDSEAVSGTEAAGQTVISVASTTGLTVGQVILFKHSTIGNSEFGQIIAVVTNTSVTLRDGLTNAQTGSTIYNQAQSWVFSLDLMTLSAQRVRLVFDASDTGRTVVAEARYTLVDSFG
jgi:hypothetical protein